MSPMTLPHSLLSIPGLLKPWVPDTFWFCFLSSWYWDVVSVFGRGGGVCEGDEMSPKYLPSPILT